MNPTHFRNTIGPDDTDALLAVHEACRKRDGTDPHSLQEYRPDSNWYRQELASSDPADWIVAVRDGQVVGYGHALWDWPEGDGTHVFLHLGWVSPAYRGQGIGSELLRRLEQRCREKAAQTPAARYEYGANASGLEVSATEHLTAQGYFVGYRLWEMERTHADVPQTALPLGYEVRPVLPEHHGAIWQCIGDAYDVSRPGGRFHQTGGEDDHHAYFSGPDADPKLWFVAWLRGRVAGQVLCRLRPWGAEVYEVSVGYAHRRKGLARHLLGRALTALQARQLRIVRLYTVYENPDQAWRLYEQLGFRTVGTFPRWRKGFSLE